LSNSGINVQNKSIARRDNVAIEPQPKYCALGGIAAFCQQNTDF